MNKIKINTDFIKLDSFLKLTLGLSGGMAKNIIADELVLVDGEVETRRGRKLRSGMVIEAMGESFVIE